MPFPEVKHCLICEDVRAEKRKLATLVGFYGIAPDVHMLIRDFAEPIQRLCFLVIVQGGGGDFRVLVELRDSGGAVVAKGSEITVSTPGGRGFLAFALMPILLPRPGTYTFALVVDGHTHYQNTFEASQGQPQDFE